MLKLRIKDGMTLLETMISISIFSILFLMVLTFRVSLIKNKLYNEKISEMATCIEILRNRILYNTNYNVIYNLKEENKEFVNKDWINPTLLYSANLPEIVQDQLIDDSKYISITINSANALRDGEDVLKITLKLNAKVLGRNEVITCEFYKGNY